MTSVALVSFLRAVLLLGSMLMVLKLYRTGLFRAYPFFFAFLLFRIPNSIWPYFLKVNSDLYQKIWVLTVPIHLIFYVLMVAELFKAVLVRYKGLASFGRWAMYASVVISVTISGLSLMPTIKPTTPQRSKIMVYVLATERGVDTALALFIILILLFISFFPLRLSRNVRVHCLIFSIFFLSNTYVLLMRSLFGMKSADDVNTILMCVTTASVVAWLTLLSKAGEESLQDSTRIGPEQESRLLSHLDALNTALLRSSRRSPAEFSSTR